MVAPYLKKQTVSFKYAFKGLFYAFSSQPNLWVHSFWALVALAAGFYFGISHFEWLVLVLTISAVFVCEMLNTGLEIVTDALKIHKRTEQDDYYIMVAKDVAAGAVLLSAVASVIVGFIIFGSRLLTFLKLFFFPNLA